MWLHCCKTTSRRPVSGLASDVVDVDPIAFPRIHAVAQKIGWNLLTVAGAAPELSSAITDDRLDYSHRLPVSPG
jgi:hypothetical protein